jgi:hypothetical protein
MTATDRDRVSALTLDVYWASGRPKDAFLEEHLAVCVRCRAYLDHLDAIAAADSIAAHPSASADRIAAPLAAKRRRWPRVAAPVVSAIAIAACTVLLLRRPDTRGYVAVKGTPAVQLLVHRGADTWIWDGRSAVHPGDALALRVSCEGLEHIAVAVAGPSGWSRLAEATCPGNGEALPFTLVVDGEPVDETFGVIFSRDAMDDRALHAAVEAGTRTSEVWVARYVVPKETESP